MSRGELKKLQNTCTKLEDKITQVLSDIDDILFINKSESVARLLPSFYDRKPFTNILTMENERPEDNHSENISYQILARKFFLKKIQEEVAAQKVQIKLFLLKEPQTINASLFKDYPSGKSGHVLLGSLASTTGFDGRHVLRGYERDKPFSGNIRITLLSILAKSQPKYY